MPKVPVLETPDVQPTGLPAPRVSLDTSGAFGQGLARATDGLTDTAAQVYARERQKAIAQDVTWADNQYQALKTSEYYGTQDDPTSGLMNMKGEAAVARSKVAYANLQNGIDNIASQLGSDEARRLFRMRAGGQYEDAVREGERYIGSQVEQDRLGDIEAGKFLAKRDIFNNFADDDSYARQVARMESSIQAVAPTPEIGAARAAEWRSEAARARIEGYLTAHDYRGASDFMALARDELGPETATLQERIAAQRDQLAGAQQAQSILQGNIAPNGLPDEAKIQADFEALPEGKLKEDTRKELGPRVAQAKAAFTQAEDQRLGRVIVGVEKTNGFLDESSADYATLSDAGKAKAQERARTIQRQLRGLSTQERREQNEANRLAINQFNSMDTDQQVKLDPTTTFPNADQSTQFAIKALQKKAAATVQKGQAPALGEFKSYVRSVAEQQGLSGDRKDVADDLLSRMVTWRSDYLEQNKDKPPTRTEVDRQLAQELTYGNKGWLGFGGQFRFQAEKEGDDFSPAKPEDQKYTPARDLLAPKPPPAQQLPPGVKRGKNGNLYQRTPTGKWAPYHG